MGERPEAGLPSFELEALKTTYAVNVGVRGLLAIMDSDSANRAARLAERVDALDGVQGTDYDGHFGPYVFFEAAPGCEGAAMDMIQRVALHLLGRTPALSSSGDDDHATPETKGRGRLDRLCIAMLALIRRRERGVLEPQPEDPYAWILANPYRGQAPEDPRCLVELARCNWCEFASGPTRCSGTPVGYAARHETNPDGRCPYYRPSPRTQRLRSRRWLRRRLPQLIESGAR